MLPEVQIVSINWPAGCALRHETSGSALATSETLALVDRQPLRRQGGSGRATISAFFRPGRATESDALSDEGEFQSCSLVHRRFLNMVDNDDFDRTFPRL
jgi:hypothetical protein